MLRVFDRKWNVKDIVAISLAVTYCISIFLPETVVSDVTMESFERVLGTVIGFYFGTHVTGTKECPYEARAGK